MAIPDPQIAQLARLYRLIERRLHAQMLNAVEGGFEWRRCEALLRQVESDLARLNQAHERWEEDRLPQEFDRGRDVAESQMRRAGIKFNQTEERTWSTLARAPLQELAKEAAGRRDPFFAQILRQSRDFLRELATGELAKGLGVGDSPGDVGRAIRDGSLRELMGGRPLQQLADGIERSLGVVYSDGSVHSLQAYGEMSARTGMMGALNAGSVTRYKSAGVDIVKISTHQTLCYLCQPLEGKGFAISAEGEALGYPPFNGIVPRHPNCRHVPIPVIVEAGELPEKPEAIAYTGTPRELYARMRDDVPDGRQRMQWARRGFHNVPEAEKLTREGKKFGPRFHQAGIEARRLEATKRVLESRGRLSYSQAMAQVTGERARDNKTGIFLPMVTSSGGQPGNRPSGPFRKSASVEKAEAFAQSLGVEAGYGSNLYMANAMNRTLAEAHAAGRGLPIRVQDDPLSVQLLHPDNWRQIPVVASGDRLILNSAADYWKGNGRAARLLAKKDFGEGWSSTAHELHVPRHELAHVEHFLKNPNAFIALDQQIDSQQRVFSAILKKRIQRAVGRYAAENPIEFVAEVRAGLIDGKQYDRRIMRLYALYGGP